MDSDKNTNYNQSNNCYYIDYNHNCNGIEFCPYFTKKEAESCSSYTLNNN